MAAARSAAGEVEDLRWGSPSRRSLEKAWVETVLELLQGI
jgi:hypothetical protein